MANTRQSLKRARQNDARYKLKHAQRARARTAVKALRNAVLQNDKELASSLLKEAEKVLDATASKKGILIKQRIFISFIFSKLSRTRETLFSLITCITLHLILPAFIGLPCE